MNIALVIVLMIISSDVHDHMRVLATYKDLMVPMWNAGLIIEYLVNCFMLFMQAHYSIMLAFYSFYVIYT